MPDFILPDEADRCEHCGEVLYFPPNCCDAAADADKWWNDNAGRMRRGLTPDEAQAAYDAAEPVPLSEERIKEIVKYAVSGGETPATRRR